MLAVADTFVRSGQPGAGQPERIAASGGDLGSTNDACVLSTTSSKMMITASNCWCSHHCFLYSLCKMWLSDLGPMLPCQQEETQMDHTCPLPG